MSRGWFWTVIVILTLFMLLCASELGAILGFFVAIAFAFLLILPLMLIGGGDGAGMSTLPDATPAIIGVIMLGCCALIALAAAYTSWNLFERGEARRGRSRAALAYAIVAIPAGLGLSMISLSTHWP